MASRVGTYTYSTDHPHAVQQAGPTTYTYDNNGNLQTKVAGGNTTTFTFNDDNRLASIAQNGVTLSCVYDHQGNRVKKTYGGSTTVYIGNLYEVTDGVATKHIFAGGTRVASIRSTIRFTLHKDHLGGLNFATNANGSVAQHDEYMPFGETRLETGTADLHHKFTDQEEDSEFGLYYYGARYYDPIIGRFISPDSIVQAPQDPQTLNRYSYCRNNPLKYVDPTGHDFGLTLLIGVLVGAAFGASVSAISGGDIGMGALTGAISGFCFATAGMVAHGLQAVVQAEIHAVAGFVSGGINAGITGNDPAQGALIGGISAGVAKYAMAGILPRSSFYQEASNLGQQVMEGATAVATGTVVGGFSGLAMGGNFGEGAAAGAWTSAYGFVFNGLLTEYLFQNGANSQLGQAMCPDCPPMQSNAPNPYTENDRYMNISAFEMFKYGGDGPWGNLVRGCLVCMYNNQADMHEAHMFCYANAEQRLGTFQTLLGLAKAGWAANQITFAQSINN